MQGKKFRFGDYEADIGLQELRRHGTRIGLQHKPFRVLELLLRTPGELVTRQELVHFLWPDSHVSFERGLNSAVNSLRLALGESSRHSHYIETRPGLGYRLLTPVEEIPLEPIRATATNSRSEKKCAAYEDYLKGRYLLDRTAEEDIHKALAYFYSAASDHAYVPLAHAGIADAHSQLALIGAVASSSASDAARAAAEIAISGDPACAPAHVARARVKMLFDWDWKGAYESVARAIEIDPSSAPAHILHASLLSTLGSYEPAVESCRTALVLDPLSFSANLQFASCLFSARQFQEVVTQCWQMLNLSASFAQAQLLLAMAYEQLEMYEEAAIEFRNAQLSATCRVPALSGLSELFAVTGRPDDSQQALRELSEESALRHVSHFWYALAYCGQGLPDSAITHLEKSTQHREPAMLSLKADARFDGLRNSARFISLLKEAGMEG